VETIDPKREPTKYFTYIDISSIDNSTQKIVKPKKLLCAKAPSRARQVLRAGDTVFSTVRTYLRNIGYIDSSLDGAVGSTGFSVLRPAHGVNSRYLYYYSLTNRFVDGLSTQMRGTSYPAVVDSQVRDMEIPLAPTAEQERIIRIVEEQFSRLDAGVVALERLRQNLRRMRVAVLQGAVTGQLVPNRGQPLDKRPLPALGILDRGRSRHRPRNAPELYGGRYPFIQTGDVTSASPWIRTFSQTYSDYGLAQSRLWPSGTLCITIAANIARTGLLAFDACFPDSVVGFVANDGPTAARWVELIVRSMQNDLEQLAPATAQKNINLAVLRALEIPYPDLSYQALVVEEYDRQMSLITSLDATIDAAVRQSARLYSSILATAFSGKLSSQDVTDEPASALLEQIAAERAPFNGNKPVRTRKPRVPQQR
jgi:type I restriction enzyme S subunit